LTRYSDRRIKTWEYTLHNRGPAAEERIRFTNTTSDGYPKHDNDGTAAATTLSTPHVKRRRSERRTTA
jgi:hypothetical protein